MSHTPLRRVTATSFRAGVALCALASSAVAQQGTPNVHVLLRSGDVVGGQTVSNIQQPSITPSGKWAALCQLGSPSTKGLVINGSLAIAEGGTTLDGSTLEDLRQVRVSSDGEVAVLFTIENTADPANPIGRLRIGDSLVLEEGRAFSFPPLGLSGTISGFYGMDYEAPFLSVGMFIRTPGGGIERAFLTGRVNGGMFLPVDGIKGGMVPPGSSSGVTYYSPTSDCSVRSVPGAAHTFNRYDGTQITRGLLSLGQVVAEHGEPGPAPNSEWNFDQFPRIRMNGSGTNVYSGQLTLSNGLDRGVVYRDGTPVAIEGGGLNGLLGGTVGEFQTAPIAVAADDTTFFCVPLSTAGFEVLMADQEVLLRAGTGGSTTVVDGELLDTMFPNSGAQTFDITRDGRTLLQRGRLANGDYVLLLVERDIADPVSCTTVPNSTGVSGEMSAEGSRFLSVNDLRLVANELPPASFATKNELAEMPR